MGGLWYPKESFRLFELLTFMICGFPLTSKSWYLANGSRSYLIFVGLFFFLLKVWNSVRRIHQGTDDQII